MFEKNGESSSRPDRAEGRVHSFRTAFRDAVLVILGCALIACTVNLLRSDGIAFVQKEEYQILVPCPETLGQAEPVDVTDLVLSDPDTLFLDARSKQEYQRWHVKGAMHVPYDYLNPVEPEVVRSIASSGARNVVAYGDGGDPDSGEHLAKEISGRGIRNVGFVKGGALVIENFLKAGSDR